MAFKFGTVKLLGSPEIWAVLFPKKSFANRLVYKTTQVSGFNTAWFTDGYKTEFVCADDRTMFLFWNIDFVTSPLFILLPSVSHVWYLITFSGIICGAFFTILYSMQWGKEKSERWLTNAMMSFALDVIIMQPVKVMALSLFVTMTQWCTSRH